METQGRDPKEIEQYRPIPNVRRQHADILVKECALSLAIYALTEWWLLAVQFGTLPATICAALIAILCTIAFRSCYAPWQERFAAYRRRNVLGYMGMFWFQEGQLRFRPFENENGWDGSQPNADPLREIGPCPKCPPGHEEHRERYAHPYAMIPLGGRRSSFKSEYDADGGIYVAGKLGRCGVGWKIGFIGLSPDGNDLLVAVTDPMGTTIRCPLRQAFTILTIADQMTPKVAFGCGIDALVAIAFLGNPKPVTIGDVIAVMDRALRETMAEHDAATSEVTRQGASSAPPT